MAYNPSIHTASNKPYGVTNKPVDARYWYYDSSLYLYRPYASIAEVLGYLIANDRKGVTVQVGTVEYWWPNSSDLSDTGLVAKSVRFEVINIPANSETPIIINFDDSTIKYGADSPEDLDVDISSFKANPTIRFKQVIDTENTKPIGNEGWITNEEWDGTDEFVSLTELTLQPDTDTGLPGGLTLDDINIIIKA